MTRIPSIVVIITSLLLVMSMTSGTCSGDDHLSEKVDAGYFMVYPIHLDHRGSISYLFMARLATTSS